MQVSEIRQQLQRNMLDPTLLTQEKQALDHFYQVSGAYEKFLHQKSKITWLRLGDDCTSYFHSSMKSRGPIIGFFPIWTVALELRILAKLLIISLATFKALWGRIARY